MLSVWDSCCEDKLKEWLWSTLKLPKVLLSAVIFIEWWIENTFQFLTLAVDLQGAVNLSGLMILLSVYTLKVQKELCTYFLLLPSPTCCRGREGCRVSSPSSHSVYVLHISIVYSDIVCLFKAWKRWGYFHCLQGISIDIINCVNFFNPFTSPMAFHSWISN